MNKTESAYDFVTFVPKLPIIAFSNAQQHVRTL
jgi:hypothetical protein